MAITKARKEELLAQYDQAVGSSRAMIVTEYRGMDTHSLERLREAMREANSTYNVVKLTLFKLALERAGLPTPDDLLTGPVAVSFVYQDVPAVAKVFKDFGKDQEKLVVKGGIMGNRVLTAAQVEAIAELPPLEILRSQLMGVISGPARSLVGIVASGVRQVVNVLNAYSTPESQSTGAEA